MSDDLTAPPPSSETGGAVSAPDTSTPSGPDTRAIAASVFADGGETKADPPPADPSTPPPPSDATTRVGEDDDPEYQSLLASGSMPVDRHKAVLTNARRKTREEVEAATRQKYGWVDDLKIDRSRTEQAMGLMRALDTNAEATLRTLAHALGVTFAPPPEPKAPEGPPPPDVRLDDGSEFYSAAQLAKLHAWKDAEFDRKLAALEERYKPLEQERHYNRLQTAAHAEAAQTLAECRAEWKYFGKLETDIKALMQASPTLTLERAYIRARAAKETELAKQAAQDEAADRASQLQRKAAASNPGPGTARPVTPLRYQDRSTRDIAAEVFGRAR